MSGSVAGVLDGGDIIRKSRLLLRNSVYSVLLLNREERMSTWKKTKSVMWQINPIAGLVAEVAEKGSQLISNASEQGVDALKEEVVKQSIQMQFAQQQARVAQELAIARRIDNAEEVEIEEFYDLSGKGNIGLSIDQNKQTGTLGLGAEGRQVTKRVYRFKGWGQQQEAIEQIMDEE